MNEDTEMPNDSDENSDKDKNSIIKPISSDSCTSEDHNKINKTDLQNVKKSDDLNEINANLENIKCSPIDDKQDNSLILSSSSRNSVDFENNEPSTSRDRKTYTLLDKSDHHELNTIDNMTETNIKETAEKNLEATEEINLSDTPLQSCSQRSSKYQNRNYRSQIDTSNSFSEDEEDLDSTQRDSVVPRNEDNENDDDDVDDDANSNHSDNERIDDRTSPPIIDDHDSSSNLSGLNYNSNMYDTDSLSESDDESIDLMGESDTETECIPLRKQDVLKEEKPKYSWSYVPEILYRQAGLSGKGRRTTSGLSPIMFQYRVGGSLHVVERLELMYKLKKHEGCVNSLNFNRAGNLLASGSDDLKIILWKWASSDVYLAFDSGHNANVFQTKFMEFNVNTDTNIISSARDGQVRHSIIAPSGSVKTSALFKHFGAVHKIALPLHNPYEILTAGEDGHVIRADIRDTAIERIVTVKVRGSRLPLYSIAAHPIDPEFCVCGRDEFIRVYDKRNIKESVKKLCRPSYEGKKPLATHITSAVYNYIGTEILASYSDEDIYLFDNVNVNMGTYLHKYQGHRNSSTIKGVNFFGPRSEYIMSGSDCANCFFWEKNSEAIIQWKAGDEIGVVNCLEPHPSFPMLATSGLDNSIKIWVPSNEKEPRFDGLKKCVHRNMYYRYSTRNDNILDDQMLHFFVRQCLRNRRNPIHTDTSCPLVDDLVSSDSDDESNMDDSDSDVNNFRNLPCSPS